MFTVNNSEVDKHKYTEKDPDPYTNRTYEYYDVKIPVTMIPKEEILRMPFNSTDYDGSSSLTNTFMDPMVLSVAENFEQGINAIITQKSFNEIATSDNPFIKTRGQINMTIIGDTPLGRRTFNLQPAANPEYAKLYPTGKVTYRYFDIEDQTKPLKDADSQTEKSMLGRSKNKAIDVEDSANYSEDFQVTPPETTTDDAGQSYRFVMVKDNKQLTGTYNHEEDQVIDLLYIRNDRGAIIVDHVDEKVIR